MGFKVAWKSLEIQRGNHRPDYYLAHTKSGASNTETSPVLFYSTHKAMHGVLV